MVSKSTSHILTIVSIILLNALDKSSEQYYLCAFFEPLHHVLHTVLDGSFYSLVCFQWVGWHSSPQTELPCSFPQYLLRFTWRSSILGAHKYDFWSQEQMSITEACFLLTMQSQDKFPCTLVLLDFLIYVVVCDLVPFSV